MSCEKHRRIPANYIGGTVKNLADEIGDLHYEELEKFLVHLSNKLVQDSFKDRKNNRPKLADALGKTASQLLNAATFIGEAWNISKPYMVKYKEYEVNAKGTLSKYNGTTEMMCLDENLLALLPVKDCNLPSGTKVKYNILSNEFNESERFAKIIEVINE